MTDYGIEDSWMAECKHDDEIWEIDLVEWDRQPQFICSMCGKVLDIKVGTIIGTEMKTTYIDLSDRIQ